MVGSNGSVTVAVTDVAALGITVCSLTAALRTGTLGAGVAVALSGHILADITVCSGRGMTSAIAGGATRTTFMLSSATVCTEKACTLGVVTGGFFPMTGRAVFCSLGVTVIVTDITAITIMYRVAATLGAGTLGASGAMADT